MLPLILLCVIVQLLIPASGYLEDCPVDRGQRIGNDLVTAVLGHYHRDMIFVGAVGMLKQHRDYRRIISETTLFGLSEETRSQLRSAAQLLAGDHCQEAIDMCDRWDREWNIVQENKPALSFLHYFRAEAYRLIDDVQQASEYITEATLCRGETKGISYNELERVNGLIVLQRVLRFNRDIDKMFGLIKGPNTNLLKSSYWLSQVSTDPTSRQEQSGYTRVRPSLDDITGHSVSEQAIKSILCEFAQKLAIVESSFSSGRRVGTDYRSISGEMVKVDPQFAAELDRAVQDPQHSWMAAEKIINSNWDALMRTRLKDPSATNFESRKEQLNTWQTYSKYLKANVLISNDDWDSLSQADLLLSEIKAIRHDHKGVSLGRLATLEGHIVFKTIKSFHRKIQYIYHLNGRETQEELEGKKNILGAQERVIPRFSY